LKTIGGPRSFKNGEFNHPKGITVDNKYIYICDKANHRIQILVKDNGNFVSKWGNEKRSTEHGLFAFPFSIYYDLPEDLVYIGDLSSVQSFRKDGSCIQRLGDKEHGIKMNQFIMVFGICVMDDRLYISDNDNKRTQIFKKTAL